MKTVLMFSTLALACSLGMAGVTGSLDPLHLDDETQAYFEARVDARAAPLRRLEALLSAIMEEDGLHYAYRAETLPASEVFRRRGGNCLSFTNLVVALGRHFGLDVRFREVEVAPSWSRHGRLVVYNQHVNALVRIGGEAFVVDLLPEVSRIELGGQTVADRRGLAHFHNNVGADRLAQGSPVQAIESFRAAIEADPDASFAWANLAVAQVCLGRLDEAEKAYQQAIRLDRRNLVALNNLAELYDKTARPGDARQIRQKLEGFRNRNPYYHFSLGLEAYEAGAYEESIRHFKDALKRKEQEPNFHHALARSYVSIGRTEAARRSLEKAVRFSLTEANRRRFADKLEQLRASAGP